MLYKCVLTFTRCVNISNFPKGNISKPQAISNLRSKYIDTRSVYIAKCYGVVKGVCWSNSPNTLEKPTKLTNFLQTEFLLITLYYSAQR